MKIIRLEKEKSQSADIMRVYLGSFRLEESPQKASLRRRLQNHVDICLLAAVPRQARITLINDNRSVEFR